MFFTEDDDAYTKCFTAGTAEGDSPPLAAGGSSGSRLASRSRAVATTLAWTYAKGSSIEGRTPARAARCT